MPWRPTKRPAHASARRRAMAGRDVAQQLPGLQCRRAEEGDRNPRREHRQGVANLLHDMRQGHISMTDESRFEVGRNVATTEGAAVFENELFQLLEYKPLDGQGVRAPLPHGAALHQQVLHPDQPAARELGHPLRRIGGHRTFVISWRNPDESLGHKTWDDYIEQAVLTAIAKTQEIRRRKDQRQLPAARPITTTPWQCWPRAARMWWPAPPSSPR